MSITHTGLREYHAPDATDFFPTSNGHLSNLVDRQWVIAATASDLGLPADRCVHA